MRFTKLINKYWFVAGLVFVLALTVADATESVSGLGSWFKLHFGAETAFLLIFFFSGLILDTRQIKSESIDIKVILVALAVIYLAAPLSAALLVWSPLDTGIIVGLFLVAAMPTTVSSGVVMTTAAGGKLAHALMITILANGLAVFTIPITLGLLLPLIGGTSDIVLDKPAIMLKIALLVLVPLGFGMLLKLRLKDSVRLFESKLQILNQILILTIVWMGLSQSRTAILNNGSLIGIIVLITAGFHAVLLLEAFGAARLFGLERGRRESIIFMGSQKTLPLSIILQVTYFPQFGQALVVCVVHHLVHLLIDSYIVGKLRE
ncbi:MAG: bile acid:sodium symporter [Deltaproteobacteria bacterium]|nr:bile acid:sodium symporter [Deltaproteobacteria bacterium]